MSSYVYLAGPISGLSYDEATLGWRNEFIQEVDRIAHALEMNYLLLPLSPMRGKTFLRHEKELGLYAYPGATAKATMARDFSDIERAAVVVVGFHEWEPGIPASVGTLIEMGYARAFNKPIIMIKPKHSGPYTHGWVTELADIAVDTVLEAVEQTINFCSHGGV